MTTQFSQFLACTEIIDWQHESVRQLAGRLASKSADATETTRRSFEWVRDSIRHSSDYQLNPVTCAASEVLEHGTGYCYAKSHLLAALLRANEIPAGFCYQRLSIDDVGPPFCLHGLNAVYLPKDGWYRIDPRGNHEGICAEFSPPEERLAFATSRPGEENLPGVYDAPLQVVVDALGEHTTWDILLENLPDVET